MITYIRERARRDFQEALFESCADETIALKALCDSASDSPLPNAAIKRVDGRCYHAGSLFAPTLDSVLSIALACLASDGSVEISL